MSERYPSDTALLALTEDAETGAAYIATGQSPYYAEFRRLIHRMLAASRRANDLRVYQDGDLTVGVRAGRCVIGNSGLTFTGVTGHALADNATHYLWLTSSGSIGGSTSGLPADRTTFLPLAQVTCASGAITEIIDLRGQAYLVAPSLEWLAVTATAAQINQALAGIGSTVTASNLTALTQSPSAFADALHTHTQVLTDADAQTELRLINSNDGDSANIALIFDLPNRLAEVTRLLPDPETGWLWQSIGGASYCLPGTVHCQCVFEGEFVVESADKVMGCVPIDGVVSDVILSIGSNLVSTDNSDNICAAVKVGGVPLCATDPQISVNDGTGFRSTAQGHGVAAVVTTSGAEQVARGSILTLQITRTAVGIVSNEASNISVLLVIRPNKPE